MSASVGNALPRTFNALLGAPFALMEQLRANVLPENVHNTVTSGLLKNVRSQILVPSP